MKGLRIVSILLMVGLFVVSFGLPGVMAGGTATASATATGGENCAETQKTRGTGGLTVVQVRVNGVALDKSKGEYTVDRDGGSQVTVHFTKALSGGAPGPPVVPPDKVEIDFSTGNKGKQTVNITLKKC